MGSSRGISVVLESTPVSLAVVFVIAKRPVIVKRM